MNQHDDLIRRDMTGIFSLRGSSSYQVFRASCGKFARDVQPDKMARRPEDFRGELGLNGSQFVPGSSVTGLDSHAEEGDRVVVAGGRCERPTDGTIRSRRRCRTMRSRRDSWRSIRLDASNAHWDLGAMSWIPTIAIVPTAAAAPRWSALPVSPLIPERPAVTLPVADGRGINGPSVAHWADAPSGGWCTGSRIRTTR
jgi:hypothetical protein